MSLNPFKTNSSSIAAAPPINPQLARSRFQQMLYHLQQACSHLDAAANLSSQTTQSFETLLRSVDKIGADLTKAVEDEETASGVQAAIAQEIVKEYAGKNYRPPEVEIQASGK